MTYKAISPIYMRQDSSCPDMNQTQFFVCTGKFKSWLHFWLYFWVHICVKSWRKWIWLVRSVLHLWFMSWYKSFKILTGCPSRNTQQNFLIFPLHTKSHFQFFSWQRLDAYRLGFRIYSGNYFCLSKKWSYFLLPTIAKWPLISEESLRQIAE